MYCYTFLESRINDLFHRYNRSRMELLCFEILHDYSGFQLGMQMLPVLVGTIPDPDPYLFLNNGSGSDLEPVLLVPDPGPIGRPESSSGTGSNWRIEV